MTPRADRKRSERLREMLEVALEPDEGEARARQEELQQSPVARMLVTEARAAFVVSPRDRRVRLSARVIAGLYALEGAVGVGWIGYEASGVAGVGVLVAVKSIVFVVLCLLAAANLGRFASLLTLAAGAEALTALLLGVAWVLHGSSDVLPSGMGIAGDVLTPVWLVLSLALASALGRARWVLSGPEFLQRTDPLQYGTLKAVAEVATDPLEISEVPPDQVAANVDGFLARAKVPSIRRLVWSLTGLALSPLRRLQPPLPLMPPGDRRAFLERALAGGAAKGRGRRAWRAIQLVTLGDYGDPRSSRRSRDELDRRTASEEAELRITSPEASTMEADVVVVGSGAAACVVAHRLALAGRAVVVLERGPYVPHRRLGQDEVERYLRLHEGAGVGLVADFRLRPVAGCCVGGGGRLSSGELVAPPPGFLRRFEGFDDGLLEASSKSVLALVAAEHGRPAPADALARGLETLGANFSTAMDRVAAVHGESTQLLIAAQKAAAHGLRVLDNCTVEHIDHEDGRAMAVQCRVRGGSPLGVRAASVVLAAGARHSAALLRDSKIERRESEDGGHIVHPQLLADFAEPIHADHAPAATLQLSRPGQRPLVIGARLHPWLTQALLMAGTFERRAYDMRRYGHLLGAEIVAGLTGRDRESARWMADMVDNLKLVAGALLAGGATRVVAPVLPYLELRSKADLAQLDVLARQPDGLSLGLAYPVGGLRAEPGLRVPGFKNLYVCDASVVSAELAAPPQLTVMTLAQAAAGEILASPKR